MSLKESLRAIIDDAEKNNYIIHFADVEITKKGVYSNNVYSHLIEPLDFAEQYSFFRDIISSNDLLFELRVYYVNTIETGLPKGIHTIKIRLR